MRVNDSEIDWQESGDTAYFQNAPYTGEIAETIANGTIVSLTSFVDGRQTGLARIWYPDGTLREEWLVENGHAVGPSRTWHDNGTLAELQVYDKHGHMTTQLRWDQEGNVLRPTPGRRS